MFSCDPSWTSDDTKHAILASLVPGAVGIICFKPFYKDKDDIEWWKSRKTPNWAPRHLRCYAGADVVAFAPVGCAGYMLYKYGSGFQNKETALALGMYGGSLALWIALIPLMKKRDWNGMLCCTTAIHLTGLGATIIAFKVHRCAGLLMIPYVLWSGFYAILTYSMRKLNS